MHGERTSGSIGLLFACFQIDNGYHDYNRLQPQSIATCNCNMEWEW